MSAGDDGLVRSGFEAFLPATLFERRRKGLVAGLDAVAAADERLFVAVGGPRLAPWGAPDRPACIVRTVRGRRVVRMQDHPNRAGAPAAGLAPEPQADEPGPR